MKSGGISIVIPAFNEEKNIDRVVKEAASELVKITSDWEIVLVNDGSKDSTGRKIDLLAKNNKKIRSVHHQQNRGFTGAMKTCFKSASKECLFLAPADGQFDFKELGSFVKAMDGHDVVIAYRLQDDIPFGQKLRSNLLHLPFLFLCRYLLGIKLREFSTVSLWKKRVVDLIDIKADDRSALFLPEIISKATKKGYRFAEVPIYWHQRRAGEAKGTGLRVALKSGIAIIKLWRQLQGSK